MVIIIGVVVVFIKKELFIVFEYYEKVVEREVVGNLGDSLRLYRKVFRVCFVFFIF